MPSGPVRLRKPVRDTIALATQGVQTKITYPGTLLAIPYWPFRILRRSRMAPERVGMLTVLDLSFDNGDLISKTEQYLALTNEELSESAGKLRVDWTAIERP